MRKSRKFISMPIVSIEEGLQIGLTKGLVVNPALMEVAALIIDQRGWFREQKIIPYSKVKNVGGDAITIDQSSQVQKSTSLPEILRLIKEKASPISAKVIVEDGTLVGHVDEFYIDEATGKIVTLEVSGKFLENIFRGKALVSTEYVRTMGSDVIVLKNGAQDALEKVDGGLQDTLSTLKDSTSQLWASTKTKTKKLGHNIKEITKEKSKRLDGKPKAPGISVLTDEPVTIIPENVESVIDAGEQPLGKAEELTEELSDTGAAAPIEEAPDPEPPEEDIAEENHVGTDAAEENKVK